MFVGVNDNLSCFVDVVNVWWWFVGVDNTAWWWLVNGGDMKSWFVDVGDMDLWFGNDFDDTGCNDGEYSVSLQK